MPGLIRRPCSPAQLGMHFRRRSWAIAQEFCHTDLFDMATTLMSGDLAHFGNAAWGLHIRDFFQDKELASKRQSLTRLLEGHPIYSNAPSHCRLGEREARRMFKGLLAGLEHIHNRGVVSLLSLKHK